MLINARIGQPLTNSSQFDGETAWVRLYHRPTDGRARILFIAGRQKFYCIQLSHLKAIRRKSAIWLCRVRANGTLELWANLNFAHYERMRVMLLLADSC